MQCQLRFYEPFKNKKLLRDKQKATVIMRLAPHIYNITKYRICDSDLQLSVAQTKINMVLLKKRAA
ncbi:hypothetical protein Q5738_15595 [Citrobacter werkmanii]|uniref:hypothetical protein n=1 Tax=Citrobacter werkmanii TaxID=67827 RepID=UPI002718AC81|nr:hypothetical protein [Citrobacter werkmanii]MDO8234984.1 hypothetical protein [Citrobacter werkmanii]